MTKYKIGQTSSVGANDESTPTERTNLIWDGQLCGVDPVKVVLLEELCNFRLIYESSAFSPQFCLRTTVAHLLSVQRLSLAPTALEMNMRRLLHVHFRPGSDGT